MEWVETTGRTVEEAKEAALDQLGVDEQDAEFDIVEEPRFGLFGRLRSEARVRARVRPTKPRPKEERRDRRGRRRVAGSDGPPAGTDDQPPTPAGPRPATRRPAEPESGAATTASRPSTSRTPRGAATVAGADNDDRDDGNEGARNNRRRRTSSRQGPAGEVAAPGEAARDAAAAHEGGDDDGSREEPRVAPRRARTGRSPDSERGERNSFDDPTTSPGGGMDVSLDEQGDVAREFLDGLAERMNLEAEVVITQPEDETIELNLLGQDLGLLIGPKGTTLLAIQDLTRTVVQRKTSAANGRILVDVAGYRRKRKDALARFSRQVAEEVRATGTRRVLEPMSAADRKVVHDTVNDIEGVMTISEGEDPRRRVVILPVAADA